MRRKALFLILISTVVFGGCHNGGKIDDSAEEIIDDDSDNVIESGTLLAKASFEGTMLPFTHEYDGADIYTDPTAPDSSRVLRFTYPPGHPSGYSTDLAWIWFEDGATEIKVEYFFKYSDNFFFHPVANKQAYFDVGDKTNFVLSAVDTNNIGGVGTTTVMRIGCQDNNTGITELKTPNMVNVDIYPNIWYKVTLYFKLNKDGKRDGILKIWIDDTQIMDYADVLFNSGIDANTPFSCLKFDPVWGGVGDPKPDTTDYFYIDAVKIWAGPFEER